MTNNQVPGVFFGCSASEKYAWHLVGDDFLGQACDSRTVRSKIVQALRRDPSVRFAYLFGSRGRGTPRDRSDWDIGVYLDPPPSDGAHGRSYARLYWVLSKALRTNDVDVVILNCAPPNLAHKVVSEGKRILLREKRAFVRFFVRLMGQLDDFRHLREVHIARMKTRHGKGGQNGRSIPRG